MFSYQIGYSTMDNSSYHELTHEKEFSKKELEQMFIDAVLHILRTGGEKDYNHIDNSFPLSTQFPAIQEETTKLMIKKFGFKKLKYKAKVDVNGWGAILDKERDFPYNDEILCKISKEYWEIKKNESKMVDRNS